MPSQYEGAQSPKELQDVDHPGLSAIFEGPKEDTNTLVPEPTSRHSSSLPNVPGISPSQAAASRTRVMFTNQPVLLYSSLTCFSCYLAAERRRAWGRHSTASIKRGPKNHSVRAGEAAHHHVASAGWWRASPEESWRGLHVPRGSGDVIWWENTRRHVGWLEHAWQRSVSRLTHQSWRRDHGSLDRRHLLAWLHELLLLLLLLLL